ncbi:MAG: bifunctional diguanylate cyclase/phosphodiesterase [Candidatus Dormibacter sp.]
MPVVVRVLYGLLGFLLVSYFAWLIVRRPDQSSGLVDGWLVAGGEVVVALLCLARAIGPRRGRAIPLLLGAGVLSWAIGDVLLTLESAGGATAPTPSLADAFYLGFYPFVYVAVGLLVHKGAGKLSAASWLDGAVAGLGAAAVAATFAFNRILQTVGGDGVAVAAHLAYPIGDVLLLALIVGGTTLLPGRRHGPWLLLAAACALNAVGDTFNLFESAASPSTLGAVFNGIAWPTAILWISISVWLRPGRTNPLTALRTGGFLLPGLGAAAGLTILFVGTMHSIDTLALGLALATLATVGLRLALSVRRLRALTEERHRQAMTDELTGLGNRRQLFSLLDSFFADNADTRTAQRDLAFLFIDLDHFKEINDSFGHAAGDDLLRQLGPRLASSLRPTDILVRVGGDEFGVLIMDATPRYASSVAERLMARLEEPFVLDSVTVGISASIGIATAPTDATESTGLLRSADLAMYRAKLGISSIEIYTQAIDDGGNRLRLVEELRAAVGEGGFVLHYQPQLDLRSGEISAVEALVRWPHPRLGLVPPLDFLPLAEEAGLMQPLTALIFDSALAQCAAWHADGRRLTVSVNVSPSNLLDPGFVDSVRDALARHRLPASALSIEITETTIIGDFGRCKQVIAQLRGLGVGVSVDDFGAGFTSLAYLGSLAVSELKLDRRFITDLSASDGKRDLALVRATVELGHALGLRVVAEGIEDAATLEMLTSVGCDFAQGYFICRPMPASDVDLSPWSAAPRPMAVRRAS